MRWAGEWTSAACARRTTDSANQTRDAPSQTNDEGTDAFPTRIREPSKESDADMRLTLANVIEQPASFYPASSTKQWRSCRYRHTSGGAFASRCGRKSGHTRER